MRRFSIGAALATLLSVIALDQATKYLAHAYISPAEPVRLLPVLQLVNVRNTGAAFGMFSSLGNAFFIIVSLIAIAFVAYLLIRTEESRLSLTLILGGAVGNLIDRLWLGYVRDFIDAFVSGHHWPAFNVADSALSVGLVLLLAGSLFHRKKQPGV